MAYLRPRGSSLFSGLVLMLVGALLLLHNYHGFSITHALGHWWPLILIFWGAIKLYERTAASRAGASGSARITPGEIFLILGLLTLLGIVIGVDYGKQHLPGEVSVFTGEKFPFDLDVAPKSVPPDARITIRNGRGDISVRASNESQIRVAGKKIANPISVEITQNGDAYEIHPAGTGSGNARISLDLDVSVPKKSALTIRNEKGDISVSDMARSVSVS